MADERTRPTLTPVVDAPQRPTLTPLQQETPAVVHSATTAQPVDVPNNMATKELVYLDSLQNKQTPNHKFFGFSDLGDAVDSAMAFEFPTPIDFVKAATGSTASMVAEARSGSALRKGELLEQEIKDPSTGPAFPARVQARALAREGVGDIERTAELLELSDELKTTSQTILDDHKRFMEKYDLEGEGLFYDLSGATVSVAGVIGSLVVLKNALPATALFAKLQQLSIYKEFREEGKSIESADVWGAVAGATEGAIELFGGKLLLPILQKSKGFKSVLFGAVEEGSQGFFQELSTEVITQSQGVREVDVIGGLKNSLYSGFLEMVAGGGSVAIHNAIKSRAKDGGVTITEEQVQTLTDNMIKSQSQLVRALVSEVQDQQSPVKFNSKDRDGAEKAAADFIKGNDIDISVLPQDVQDSIIKLKEATESEAVKQEAVKAKETAKDEKKILKGRLKSLDQEISGADAEIDAQQALLAERVEQNKTLSKSKQRPIKAIENKINKLLDARDKADEARAEILTAEDVAVAEAPSGKVITDKDVAVKEAKEKDIVLKGADLERANIKASKDRVRQYQKGWRKGVVDAKRNVRKIQDHVTKVINEHIPKNQRGEFLADVKRFNDKNFEKELVKLNSKISRKLELNERKRVAKAVKQTLKHIKPKSPSGIKKGKFNAEIQKTLNNLKDISDLKLGENGSRVTKDKAREILAVRRSQQDSEGDTMEALENDVLAIAVDPKSVSPQRAQEILLELSEIKEKGLAAGRLREFKRLKRRLENRELGKAIFEGAPKKKIKGVRRIMRESGKTARGSLSSWSNDWYGVTDTVTGVGDKAAADKFNERMDPFEAEHAEREGLSESTTKIMDAMVRAFNGVTDIRKAGKERGKYRRGLEKDAWKRLHNDTDQDKTTFIGVDAHGNDVELTRAEMRTAYFMLKRKQSRERMMSENGNGWTEAMEQDLYTSLDEKDYAFIAETRKFFDEYYKKNAKAYEEKTGVELENDPDYFPIRGKIEASDKFDEFLNEMHETAAIKAGAFKDVKRTTRPVKLTNDLDVIQSHILEMEHFRAWDKKIRDINDILNDTEFRDNVEDRYGDVMLNTLDNLRDIFVRGGSKSPVKADRIINKLRLNFSGSVLGPRPMLALKQQVSMLAMAKYVPPHHLVKGMAKSMKNPRKTQKILNEMAFYRDRHKSVTRDLKEVQQSAEWAAFRRAPTFLNALRFGATTKGDKVPLFTTGGAMYYYLTDEKGMSHEQALKKVEAALDETQQSSSMSRMSVLQQQNVYGKLMTTFMNSPLQYQRIIANSTRQFYRGRISAGEWAKNVAIFQFLLPMMWQLAGDLGRFNPHHQARAALVGPWNSLFVVGQVVSAVGRATMNGLFDDDDEKLHPDLVDVTQFATELGEALNGLDFDDIELEEVMEAMEAGANSIGLATGVPVKPITGMVKGAYHAANDGVSERFMWEMMGAAKSSTDSLEEESRF